jgi:RNA polymerase sigma-70 factor (ECF subfamily)
LDLDQALELLPRRARQVFVLYDVEGYGHEEIAQTLGVSVGTSKSQLHRARALLRERLS